MSETQRSEPPTHAIMVEAPRSTAPWTRTASLEALRYAGTGWWLDAILPHQPHAFLACVTALPLGLWLLGYLGAPDREFYVGHHDISGQVLFIALHLLALRLLGGLFARGLDPSLSGLGVSDEQARWFRRGLLGPLPNLASLLVGGSWMVRDVSRALVPDARGLTAFDDPGQWDMAALGPGIQHGLVLVWVLEWAIFGMLLWVQCWSMLGLPRAIWRTDFKPHLHRLMVRNEYRDFFALISRNATICAGFAVGNLGFVAFTGELIRRPERVASGVLGFLEEMSDLISVGLLIAVIIAGYVAYVFLIRAALTQAIDHAYARAGDTLLEASRRPLALAGRPLDEAIAELEGRLNSAVTLVRALAFQREVDALGGRGLTTVLVKALPIVGTVALRVYRMTVA